MPCTTQRSRSEEAVCRWRRRRRWPATSGKSIVGGCQKVCPIITRKLRWKSSWSLVRLCSERSASLSLIPASLSPFALSFACHSSHRLSDHGSHVSSPTGCQYTTSHARSFRSDPFRVWPHVNLLQGARSVLHTSAAGRVVQFQGSLVGV